AVAPKRDGIGAKNHGLRVGFLIGDTILVQSNGSRTQLTTRRDPTRVRFDPGAWEYPLADADAPDTGTRVSIFYRRESLACEGVENLTRRPAESAAANRLVDEMLGQPPSRLIGVTHPTELPQYSLEFIHSNGFVVELIFKCRKVGEAGGKLFERTVERRSAANT